MIKRALAHVGRQWMGALALFLALGGGIAYAANTIGSPDVIDDSLRTADLKNGAAVRSEDVIDETLKGIDIASSTITNADIANGTIRSSKLAIAPAAAAQNLSGEATQSANGKTLHADDELFDTAALHDNVSNNESFRAPQDGTYVVSAIVDWEASNQGYRRISIVGPNGNFASVSGPALGSPAITSQTATGIERLNAGQTVHVDVIQGSGGNLNARLNRFEIAFVGR